jgi:outer membrane protein assembly factor BamB
MPIFPENLDSGKSELDYYKHKNMKKYTAVFVLFCLGALSELAVNAIKLCNGKELQKVQQQSKIYGGGWAAAHADAANSDYSPVNGPRNITLAWHRKIPGTINLGPTSDERGRVFVTSSGEGCHLYALDHKTGETLWCSEEVNRFAVASSALLDSDGRIFVGDDQAMHAFDGYGKLIWETRIEGFPFSAQFTRTGRLIFLTCIGKVYVLDRLTGKALMRPMELALGLKYKPDMDARACMRGSQDCPYANTLAYDAHGSRLFFTFWKPGDKQASLLALRYSEDPAPSLVQLWQNSQLPGGSATSPDLSSDGARVYVNDNEGHLHALDSQTGLTLWKFNIGYAPGGSQSTSPKGIIMPSGGGGAKLLCIADRGDHAELLWQKNDLFNRGVATQAAGGLAYVTVKTGTLSYDVVIVDIQSGEELDREHLPGKSAFSVGTTIGFNGYIYIPTFNGGLFAFRPSSDAK